MRKRGFEVVSAFADKGIHLPARKTAASAGYDIEAAEERVLAPHEVTIVPTGIKAYMQENEYLGIHVRSGFSARNNVSFINSQGIIDADYYNNEDNEGHIMLAFHNHGDKPVLVEKGMRVAQGIFYSYLTVDGDEAGHGEKRRGGMGSTGAL
ncbi:dCTP deaminase domain-containing protein [Schwartzia sp. (in: firmicutes)]|nr:dUTP diphosphatase [Schwartzia sp. (in: firmicutes)]